MKISKSPMMTRPILSLKSSLLHGLGIWANDKLQKYATRQKAYFKRSFIVFRFEESELVVPTVRKLYPMFVKMKTTFGNGGKTATTKANSWRKVQRNKQSARDMMSPKTTGGTEGGANQRDILCLQKGNLD
jgi:hypothetical protein